MQPNVREARDSIAGAVRAELARRRMSQRDAAEIIGVDQGSISLRLSGDRPFRAEELAALADALGIPVTVFYGETTPAGTRSAA